MEGHFDYNAYWAQKVADGASWLDEVSPGWERKVDLNNLDLFATRPPGNGPSCLLCQITGLEWDDAVRSLTPKSQRDRPLSFASREMEPYWIDLIKERFNSGTLSDSHLT